MRLHDLGPLEVSIDGARRSIRGRRPTAALVLLVVKANRVVSVDAVWGDDASVGAVSTLESHVFRLRRQLEPGRASGAAPAVLLKQGNGYRLVAAVDQLDSLRFAALNDEAGRRCRRCAWWRCTAAGAPRTPWRPTTRCDDA